jgi:hypothetical protein
MIPGEAGTKDGLSYWFPDEDGVEEMLTEIYNLEPEAGEGEGAESGE